MYVLVPQVQQNFIQVDVSLDYKVPGHQGCPLRIGVEEGSLLESEPVHHITSGGQFFQTGVEDETGLSRGGHDLHVPGVWVGAFQVEQEFAYLDVPQDDVVLIHQGRVLPG